MATGATHSGTTAATNAAGRAIASSGGSGVSATVPGLGAALMSRIMVIRPDSVSGEGTLSISATTYTIGAGQWRTNGTELEYLRANINSLGMSSGASLAAGKVSVVGIVFDGSILRFYVDGRRVAYIGAGYMPTEQASGLLFNRSSNDERFAGQINFVADWPGVYLSDNAMSSLTLNPWQLVQPNMAPVFYTAAAPSGFKSAWAVNANSVLQGSLAA